MIRFEDLLKKTDWNDAALKAKELKNQGQAVSINLSTIIDKAGIDDAKSIMFSLKNKGYKVLINPKVVKKYYGDRTKEALNALQNKGFVIESGSESAPSSIPPQPSSTPPLNQGGVSSSQLAVVHKPTIGKKVSNIVEEKIKETAPLASAHREYNSPLTDREKAQAQAIASPLPTVTYIGARILQSLGEGFKNTADSILDIVKMGKDYYKKPELAKQVYPYHPQFWTSLFKDLKDNYEKRGKITFKDFVKEIEKKTWPYMRITNDAASVVFLMPVQAFQAMDGALSAVSEMTTSKELKPAQSLFDLALKPFSYLLKKVGFSEKYSQGATNIAALMLMDKALKVPGQIFKGVMDKINKGNLTPEETEILNNMGIEQKSDIEDIAKVKKDQARQLWKTINKQSLIEKEENVNAVKEQKTGTFHESMPESKIPEENKTTGEGMPAVESSKGVRESGQEIEQQKEIQKTEKKVELPFEKAFMEIDKQSKPIDDTNLKKPVSKKIKIPSVPDKKLTEDPIVEAKTYKEFLDNFAKKFELKSINEHYLEPPDIILGQKPTLEYSRYIEHSKQAFNKIVELKNNYINRLKNNKVLEKIGLNKDMTDEEVLNTLQSYYEKKPNKTLQKIIFNINKINSSIEKVSSSYKDEFEKYKQLKVEINPDKFNKMNELFVTKRLFTGKYSPHNVMEGLFKNDENPVLDAMEGITASTQYTSMMYKKFRIIAKELGFVKKGAVVDMLDSSKKAIKDFLKPKKDLINHYFKVVNQESFLRSEIKRITDSFKKYEKLKPLLKGVKDKDEIINIVEDYLKSNKSREIEKSLNEYYKMKTEYRTVKENFLTAQEKYKNLKEKSLIFFNKLAAKDPSIKLALYVEDNLDPNINLLTSKEKMIGDQTKEWLQSWKNKFIAQQVPVITTKDYITHLIPDWMTNFFFESNIGEKTYETMDRPQRRIFLSRIGDFNWYPSFTKFLYAYTRNASWKYYANQVINKWKIPFNEIDTNTPLGSYMKDWYDNTFLRKMPDLWEKLADHITNTYYTRLLFMSLSVARKHIAKLGQTLATHKASSILKAIGLTSKATLDSVLGKDSPERLIMEHFAQSKMIIRTIDQIPGIKEYLSDRWKRLAAGPVILTEYFENGLNIFATIVDMSSNGKLKSSDISKAIHEMILDNNFRAGPDQYLLLGKRGVAGTASRLTWGMFQTTPLKMLETRLKFITKGGKDLLAVVGKFLDKANKEKWDAKRIKTRSGQYYSTVLARYLILLGSAYAVDKALGTEFFDDMLHPPLLSRYVKFQHPQVKIGNHKYGLTVPPFMQDIHNLYANQDKLLKDWLLRWGTMYKLARYSGLVKGGIPKGYNNSFIKYILSMGYEVPKKGKTSKKIKFDKSLYKELSK